MQRFVRGTVRLEFGLAAEVTDGPLEQIEWLGEDGPNPNVNVGRHLPQLLAQASFRTQRLDVSRTVLRGLRSIPQSPWLVIDGTDLREAVKKAAAFSFRMALAEEAAGLPDFWHEVTNWYEQGFWPAGLISSNRLVVL